MSNFPVDTKCFTSVNQERKFPIDSVSGALRLNRMVHVFISAEIKIILVIEWFTSIAAKVVWNTPSHACGIMYIDQCEVHLLYTARRLYKFAKKNRFELELGTPNCTIASSLNV